jgi:hypothetical protein
MKKNKIIYWISTVLFAAFMIFSAVPNILQTESSNAIFTYLGYPLYISPLLGVAKLLGSIAILIPGLRKIKEWAYAGLFFDLIGATYSVIAKDGLQSSMAIMIIPFALGIISYIYNEKVYDHTVKA